MRSVPQSRLSRDMLMINARTSGLSGGRPPRERDFQRQKRRQPCRCQRTTVSGVTQLRCSRQPVQKRRATTHRSLSEVRSRARGRGARGTGQHGELMPQQQVLEHEILARANAGQDSRQEQPEQFKHVLSIADLRSREVLPPHNTAMAYFCRYLYPGCTRM